MWFVLWFLIEVYVKYLQSIMTIRKGIKLVYNKTLDSCRDSVDNVLKNIRYLVGFPHWDCSAKPGSFCNKNKVVATLNVASLKIIDLIEPGLIRVQYVTTFDQGRKACAFIEVKIAS
jgi:hypothetical protein